MSSSVNTINQTFIIRKWEELNFSKRLSKQLFCDDALLNRHSMLCLKNSHKSSIWKLEVTTENKNYPVILKVIRGFKRDREKNKVEVNMYRKAYPVLRDYMPRILRVQSRVEGDVWVLMDYMQNLEKHIILTPEHLYMIIPRLAALHAETYNQRYLRYRGQFSPWLPEYSSKEKAAKRRRILGKTLQYLDEAVQRPGTRKLLLPAYSCLTTCLTQGPDYFPEVAEAGYCVVHNDLAMINICRDNFSINSRIKFIDWESAQYMPCWFDLVKLTESFLSKNQGNESIHDAKDKIIRRCALLYAEEMDKHGISFGTFPVTLYKMAFLKQVLEINLYIQLRRELKTRGKGNLLKHYIYRINTWGKELSLF